MRKAVYKSLNFLQAIAVKTNASYHAHHNTGYHNDSAQPKYIDERKFISF